MVYNLYIIIASVPDIIRPQLTSITLKLEEIGIFVLWNLPALILLFTQVNALLYIYEAKEGKHLITNVNFDL